MEMVFVILFVNREALVLPDKYPKTQCEEVIKAWGSNGKCIAAPKLTNDDTMCTIAIPDYSTPYTGGMRLVQEKCNVLTHEAK